ncbi:MAG: hypothetical protein WC859_04835 [Elusimicrobiota bacterium]|jgi:hypothetical protein
MRHPATRLFFCFLLFSGCAAHHRVQLTAKPLVIRRIAVAPFRGTGGAAATDEFIRQFLRTGVKVMKQNKDADAILSGGVTEYRPDNKLTVFLSSSSRVNASGQTVAVSNPIVSLSGNPVMVEGTSFSQPGIQMIAVNASVGVSARITNAVTGAELWSGDYTYEGIDPSAALSAVVRLLVQSMGRVLSPADRAAPARSSTHGSSR